MVNSDMFGHLFTIQDQGSSMCGSFEVKGLIRDSGLISNQLSICFNRIRYNFI